ncbi:MAG: hypothetical protein R3C01_05830 [Planctomycetaceae bacterium]
MATAVILWTARLSMALAIAALACRWVTRSADASLAHNSNSHTSTAVDHPTLSTMLSLQRLMWCGGWLFLMLHFLAVFGLQLHWSHDAAWEHTAEATARIVGRRVGVGVWFNDLLAITWTIDMLWNTLARQQGTTPPLWWTRPFLCYFVFMAFHATIVFGSIWWSPFIITISITSHALRRHLYS